MTILWAIWDHRSSVSFSDHDVIPLRLLNKLGIYATLRFFTIEILIQVFE